MPVSKVVVLLALAALLGAAVVFYMLRGRTGADAALPPPLARWQAHLAAAGIEARGTLVRVGARANLRFNGHFEVKGSARPMFLHWYETPAAAQAQFAVVQRYPEGATSLLRGALLLNLPDWPADAELTQRVRAAFGSFDAPEARAAP